MKELDESKKNLEDIGFLESEKLTPETRSNIISMVNSEFLSPEERDQLVTGLNIEFLNAHNEADSVSSKKEHRNGDLQISRKEKENKLEVITPKIIDTKPKFESVLSAFPEIRLGRWFATKYREAGEYYENGMMGDVPSLVREIDERVIRHLYEDIHGGPPKVRIESMKDVDRLLKKYPEEREERNFQERYRKSRISFEVRNNHSMTQKELAEVYSIRRERVSECLMGKRTTLISRLRRYEEDKILEEWKLTNLSNYIHERESDTLEEYFSPELIETIDALETSILKINSADVPKVFDLESPSVENLTSIAVEVYQQLSKTNANIAYIEIKEGNLENSPLIEQALQENREEIERELRQDISDECIHVGIVEGRVYVWTPDITPNDMINAWSDQNFHFKTSNLSQIILEVGKNLQVSQSGYEQLHHLNTLVEQVISPRPADRIRIRDGESRIMGEILHLQCDILGVSPRVMEDRIEKVTGRNGHGGIIKPKIIRGREVEILRARLGATVNSDCWLGEGGRLQYTEANLERIKVVERLLQQFGDISLTLIPNDENNSFRMWIPKPIGNAFIYWGFTTGDKPIRNERLPESVRDGSLDSYIAYLEDLISEEGCFDLVSGFRWSRTIVLKLGTYDSKYEMVSKLSQESIEFLENFEHARRDDDAIYIPVTRLENYKETTGIVEKILSIVKTSRSNLIDDESSLAIKLGIDITVYPEYVVIYKDTGRISLKWVAKTKGKDDAIRWALIASPNDPRKNEMVQRWLSQIPDDVERVKKQ
ncbi:MAG: hypothetical protein ACTSYJ_06200 [Candidatus Thorarchaeota archaeon]